MMIIGLIIIVLLYAILKQLEKKIIDMIDISKLKIGDIVLAIGNPYNFGQTITQGIVSATGRKRRGISFFDDFIQTDAVINQGHSGGALINIFGELKEIKRETLTIRTLS